MKTNKGEHGNEVLNFLKRNDPALIRVALEELALDIQKDLLSSVPAERDRLARVLGEFNRGTVEQEVNRIKDKLRQLNRSEITEVVDRIIPLTEAVYGAALGCPCQGPEIIECPEDIHGVD